MFEQLKKQFLASFEAKSAHLEQALEQQDLETLTVSIHQLAGSSGSFGCDDISELCIEIESMIHDESTASTTHKKIHELIKLMRDKTEFKT